MPGGSAEEGSGVGARRRRERVVAGRDRLERCKLCFLQVPGACLGRVR
jgi:hypothetical protein